MGRLQAAAHHDRDAPVGRGERIGGQQWRAIGTAADLGEPLVRHAGLGQQPARGVGPLRGKFPVARPPLLNGAASVWPVIDTGSVSRSSTGAILSSSSLARWFGSIEPER